MPKQTFISNANKKYLEDRENGVTREQHYNTVDTVNRMLAEYEQEQQEEEERRRQKEYQEYQRRYSQFQAKLNRDIADWIKDMSPTALQDRAQQTIEPVRTNQRAQRRAYTTPSTPPVPKQAQQNTPPVPKNSSANPNGSGLRIPKNEEALTQAPAGGTMDETGPVSETGKRRLQHTCRR